MAHRAWEVKVTGFLACAYVPLLVLAIMLRGILSGHLLFALVTASGFGFMGVTLLFVVNILLNQPQMRFVTKVLWILGLLNGTSVLVTPFYWYKTVYGAYRRGKLEASI